MKVSNVLSYAYNLTSDSDPYMLNRRFASAMSEIGEFASMDTPCQDCITYAMCINKPSVDIIFCPLLDHIFYREALKLGYKNTDGSAFFRLLPLDITIWIHRQSKVLAHIDIIINDNKLEKVCRRLELSIYGSYR